MKKRLCLWCLALAFPSLGICQENAVVINHDDGVKAHSLSLPQSPNPLRLEVSTVISPPDYAYQKLNMPDSLRIIMGDFANSRATLFRSDEISFMGNPHSRDYAAARVIHKWDNGALFGVGSYNSYPALGNIASASFSLSQGFGRFYFTGAVTGSKYHLDRNLYNDYSLAGRLSYQLSGRVAFNAFGSYSLNNTYHSMAAMPYLNQSSYGASMSLDINDKWSVEMGAQRYFDPYSHRWITTPVFIPSFNFNGAKIGMDFGWLVGDILHAIFDNNNLPAGYPQNTGKHHDTKFNPVMKNTERPNRR